MKNSNYTNQALAEYLNEELEEFKEYLAEKEKRHIYIAKRVLDETEKIDLKPHIKALKDLIGTYTEEVKKSSSDALKMAEKRNIIIGMKAISIYLGTIALILAFMWLTSRVKEENRELRQQNRTFRAFIQENKLIDRYNNWIPQM